MAQAPSRFGEIEGFPPNSTFPSREAVRKAGLHRHEMRGISGHYEQGADAIVVSGGYADDEDHGNTLIYTGEGGQQGKRQVQDRKLKEGNQALILSGEHGLPVRVIRKIDPKNQTTDDKYIYDGLYKVDKSWMAPSKDGPLIWRFALEKITSPALWTNSLSDPPPGNYSPARAAQVTQRIVRNSAVTEWVKEQHAFRCQMCDIVLNTRVGRYAEGAHIKPLGVPHHGHDVTSNILCLCPNDHVLFDKGALYISGTKVFRTDNQVPTYELTKVFSHIIDINYIDYHREVIAGIPAK